MVLRGIWGGFSRLVEFGYAASFHRNGQVGSRIFISKLVWTGGPTPLFRASVDSMQALLLARVAMVLQGQQT